MILDPIDQRVRDQGFNFVPFNEYLAEEFRPNTLDMSGGISTLPMAQPGGSPVSYLPTINQGGDGAAGDDDDDDATTGTTGSGKFGFLNIKYPVLESKKLALVPPVSSLGITVFPFIVDSFYDQNKIEKIDEVLNQNTYDLLILIALSLHIG